MRLPLAPGEITAPWLSEVLGGPVEAVVIEEVRPGAATKVRVRLDDSRTVIVKAPLSGAAQDEATLSFFALEVGFYRDVAELLDVGAPRCLYADTRPTRGRHWSCWRTCTTRTSTPPGTRWTPRTPSGCSRCAPGCTRRPGSTPWSRTCPVTRGPCAAF
jgi:hypothetical protein